MPQGVNGLSRDSGVRLVSLREDCGLVLVTHPNAGVTCGIRVVMITLSGKVYGPFVSKQVSKHSREICSQTINFLNVWAYYVLVTCRP